MPTDLAYQPPRQIWTPDPPQIKAVKFGIEHAAAGLLLDPGFGKTAVTLAIFSFLKEQGYANRMLVLAPARVMDLVWPAEIEKWKDFEHLSYQVVHGTNKEDLLWQAIENDTDVIITNFESLSWLLGVSREKTKRGYRVHTDKKRFKKLGIDTLCIDELAKFKHSNNLRYSILKSIVHMFSYRYGLTGSPAANGLEGLFGQCFILDEGETLGRFVTHYRRKYFRKIEYGHGYELLDGAEEKIYKAIAPLMLRIDEVEARVKLPKMQTNTIYVDLPPKAQKLHDQVEKGLVAELDGRKITTANAGTRSMKLRQILSGGVYPEEDLEEVLKRLKFGGAKNAKREVLHIHDAKTDALGELIDELEGKPLFIGYEFKHDLDRLAKLPHFNVSRAKDLPYIGGGTTDHPASVTKKRAKELEQQWLRGDIPLLIGNPASVAHGLNLQRWGNDYPRHVAWYTLPWDYELYDQFIRRIRRRGNMASRVFIHHLLVRDSLDDYVLAKLHSKRRVQNALFDALKSLRDEKYTPEFKK